MKIFSCVKKSSSHSAYNFKIVSILGNFSLTQTELAKSHLVDITSPRRQSSRAIKEDLGKFPRQFSEKLAKLLLHLGIVTVFYRNIHPCYYLKNESNIIHCKSVGGFLAYL